MRVPSVFLFAILFAASLALAEHSPEQQKALAALRGAISAHQLGEIDAALAKAKEIEGEVPYEEEVNRLELLARYVKGFWESVDKGAQAALNAGELIVGEEPIAMVDYDRRTFVIRKEGQNKRYTIETIPPKLALVVSNLKKDDKNNQVFFGAFLAMDAKGDRKLAKQFWDEAARAGVDVKFLLPELEVKLPPPPITLPELSPPLRVVLAPAQWQLRFKDGTRYERKALGKLAAQNEEGRLEVTVSDLEDPAVVQKARISGDFQCVAFLKDVVKGQAFGSFSALPSESPVLVELPEGIVKVELVRKQGVYYCRVNDEGVELPAGKTAIKAGYLGVSLVDGKPLTVGAFSLEGVK